MRRKQTRQEKARDERINRLYCASCSGVQINVMDIGKVFRTANTAIEANPAIDDTALTQVIVDFVATIRTN